MNWIYYKDNEGDFWRVNHDDERIDCYEISGGVLSWENCDHENFDSIIDVYDCIEITEAEAFLEMI